nr:unnamed protein product [Digitaria exilis]
MDMVVLRAAAAAVAAPSRSFRLRCPPVVVVEWWWGRPRPRVVWLTGYGVRQGGPTTNLARVSTRPRTPHAVARRDEMGRRAGAAVVGSRVTTTATALLDGSGQLRDAEIAFEIRVF